MTRTERERVKREIDARARVRIHGARIERLPHPSRAPSALEVIRRFREQLDGR